MKQQKDSGDSSGLIEDIGLAMVDTRHGIEDLCDETKSAMLNEAKWAAIAVAIVLVAAVSAQVISSAMGAN